MSYLIYSINVRILRGKSSKSKLVFQCWRTRFTKSPNHNEKFILNSSLLLNTKSTTTTTTTTTTRSPFTSSVAVSAGAKSNNSTASVRLKLDKNSASSTTDPVKANQETISELLSQEAIANKIKMYNLEWIYPKMKYPTKLWLFASIWTVTAVGLVARLFLSFLNRTKVHNIKKLVELVTKRPKAVPLITVSNHHSCFDDPGLWGIIPFKDALRYRCVRWSLAAHDICFTNKLHSIFFMLGKCIPVVRGAGVHQSAIDLCIQKLSLGDWVHVFPEGKVNMTKEFLRFKWGVGRIIYESSVMPIILPIWHEGMDKVLENEPPYYLRVGKKVTINVGEPLDLNEFIQDLKFRNVPEPEARKLITDKIQDELENLRRETEILHQKYLNS